MPKTIPLGDRVLVQKIEAEDVVNGIFRPDIAKERPEEGIVLNVGRGKLLDNGTRISIDVEVGQKIYFGKYSGTEMKIGGQEFLLLRESEILAKEELTAGETTGRDQRQEGPQNGQVA